ncbi:MAG: Gfo/Idh/MocA family oxidoreductase [Victivallales bacterium]|nr:Gfo/Idh/MocA family oxidoreductase [Victivallales bacterium]
MGRKGFGILGAGMISGLHADALKKSTKADLVAVCDVNVANAKKLAERFAPEAKIYSSFDDMLKDPRVEVVNIVTPNHLHADFVLKAAAAGKHVLCEKPPAMSLAETDHMIAACREAKVKFGIFVQCRVREPMRLMKAALAEGRFGKVLRVDAIMKWYRASDYYKMDAWRSNRRFGAGVTIQHAFHYIDLLQFLMGPAQAVSAKMCNLAHPDISLEDTLDARITFANGVPGFVQASTALWPGTDVRIEVYGSEGSAIMEGAAFKLWKFKDERPEDEKLRQAGDAGQATAGSDPTALASEDHQYVIDDCVDAIEQGREVCIPCTAVRPSLEIALAMYQSDREGAEAVLPVDESRLWD